MQQRSKKAFRALGIVAVAICRQSPAARRFNRPALYRIRQLADEKRVPVIAFAERCGGHRAAIGWRSPARRSLTEETYSLMGSIGVIQRGSEFYQLIGGLASKGASKQR